MFNKKIIKTIEFKKEKINLNTLDKSILKMFSGYVKNFLLDEMEKYNDKGCEAIKRIYFDLDTVIESKPEPEDV